MYCDKGLIKNENHEWALEEILSHFGPFRAFRPISAEIHFPVAMNFGIFFARSPKILLILSSVSNFCTCSSLSLHHLSLSDPLNRDREVENKIEEQDEAKMVWLVKQKGRRRRRWEEEKIAQKVKWWRNTSNNERSSIWAGYSVITWVGWVGKWEKLKSCLYKASWKLPCVQLLKWQNVSFI